MPNARPVREECCLKTRKDTWKSEWAKCMASETKSRGNQDHHQLSKEEMIGRTSLMKRVSDGELYVGESDKGKRVVIMDLDTYYQMSIVHTQQDTEVDWQKLEETQKDLRAHSRALARIFQVGGGPSNRNKGRCFDNLSSWACDPPIMHCMASCHLRLRSRLLRNSASQTEPECHNNFK